MIFKVLFYYIIGFLSIEVEGIFVERFINICKSKGILSRNWVRLIRKVGAEHLDISKVLFDQLSGTGITIEDIIEAKRNIEPDYNKWEEKDLIELTRNILRIAKPMMIIANKADLPTSAANIERIKEKYPYVIPTSAESEIALVRAAEAGLISYI